MPVICQCCVSEREQVKHVHAEAASHGIDKSLLTKRSERRVTYLLIIRICQWCVSSVSPAIHNSTYILKQRMSAWHGESYTNVTYWLRRPMSTITILVIRCAAIETHHVRAAGPAMCQQCLRESKDSAHSENYQQM